MVVATNMKITVSFFIGIHSTAIIIVNLLLLLYGPNYVKFVRLYHVCHTYESRNQHYTSDRTMEGCYFIS